MPPENGPCMKWASGLCAAVVLFAAVERAAGATEVAGPSGEVRVTVSADVSRLEWAVTFRKATVVETSDVVLTVDGEDVTAKVEPGAAERYRIDETYPARGVHSVAVNRCNGLRLPLWSADTGTRL